MAKKSKIARNRQREAVVARYAERRAKLKKASVDVNLTQAERDAAMAQLHKLPRTPRPCAFATATPRTDALAAIFVNSAYLACVCARWPMTANSRV